MKILTIIASLLLIAFSVFASETNLGVASWYGGGEPLNKYTANGEIFDPAEMTCASWYYPFNTYLKVTNIESGRYIIVRVNDRGPNKRLGRIIDLTRDAFAKICSTGKGLVRVSVEEV